ncbi:MAG: hypothetical protein GF364_20810 [Candidatus Lokiarchaeota archaeon]|nr:hypothetical protein [Candidatus Lokiarchaeota archaeon]
MNKIEELYNIKKVRIHILITVITALVIGISIDLTALFKIKSFNEINFIFIREYYFEGDLFLVFGFGIVAIINLVCAMIFLGIIIVVRKKKKDTGFTGLNKVLYFGVFLLVISRFMEAIYCVLDSDFDKTTDFFGNFYGISDLLALGLLLLVVYYVFKSEEAVLNAKRMRLLFRYVLILQYVAFFCLLFFTLGSKAFYLGVVMFLSGFSIIFIIIRNVSKQILIARKETSIGKNAMLCIVLFLLTLFVSIILLLFQGVAVLYMESTGNWGPNRILAITRAILHLINALSFLSGFFVDNYDI